MKRGVLNSLRGLLYVDHQVKLRALQSCMIGIAELVKVVVLDSHETGSLRFLEGRQPLYFLSYRSLRCILLLKLQGLLTSICHLGS